MADYGDDQIEIIDDETTNDTTNDTTTIDTTADDKTSDAVDQVQQASQGSNAESNSVCMICMEEWTIGSEHCVCCLKCGHLFGRSCIERWYKEKGPANAKCPTCNKPYKRLDIRNIWCKTIRAFDSTEIADLQRELAKERRILANEKSRNFQLKHQNDQLFSDLNQLKTCIIERDKKISKMETVLSMINKRQAERLANNSTDGTGDETTIIDIDSIETDRMDIVTEQQPKELKGKFYHAQNVDTYPQGGCKAFALCPTSAEILIAQPMPAGSPRMGNDFGIRKYSVLDTSLHTFIYLHAKPLTSMQIKPFGDLILTAGQDKKVHLTSINNSRKVQTYECLNEPAHVSWSTHRDQQFYVASRNCFVALYDMRNTSEHIYLKEERVARTTMVSMTSVTQENDLHGVLANDARGSQFLEVTDESNYESETIDRYTDHLPRYQLPFSGVMGTVDYHKPTSTTLVTTRRSPTNPNAIHNLIKLKRVSSPEDGARQIECQNVRTFYGGATELLSQSRILPHPTLEGHVLVGSCDDTARGIKMWDASDNSVYQQIRTNEFVRDMALYTPEGTNQHRLYTLHDKGFGIYRWDYV